MEYIDVNKMPPDALVRRYDIKRPAAVQGFTVPPGYEAVVYHAGDYTGPFREGDGLELPKPSGLFKRKFPDDVAVYICRRQLPKPLYWGLGGLPASGGGTFGASGQLGLSLSNARVLVRQLCAEQTQLDEAALTRRLETLVVAHIRPALISQVEGMGMRAAKAGLDRLSAGVKEALNPRLYDLGLGLSSLLVENLLYHEGVS